MDSEYYPEAFIRGIWDTLARGEKWEGELEKIKPGTATLYWLDITLVPFINKDGNPISTWLSAQKLPSQETLQQYKYFFKLPQL